MAAPAESGLVSGGSVERHVFEGIALFEDGLPGEVTPECVVQVLQAHLVCGEEDEGVERGEHVGGVIERVRHLDGAVTVDGGERVYERLLGRA